MLKSMTAFGRGVAISSIGRLAVEIQSVNRKFLEVGVVLPRELSRFEADVRKWISEKVFRGKVSVRISAQFEAEAPVAMIPNLPLVRELKKAWGQVAQELGVEFRDLVSPEMLSREGVLAYEENFADEKVYRQALHKGVEAALQKLLEMKKQEGQALFEDIRSRAVHLQEVIEGIAKGAPDATKKYREKLLARIEELLPGDVENEERLLREVALFAEKVDITEEVTRFRSHLEQMKSFLTAEHDSVGKTLEFVLQECSREINTIGAKSLDLGVSQKVIEAKSELEKIREQLQNIE